MPWQDPVRARLNDDADSGPLLDAILAGYQQGGPDAVADAIRQRLDAVETAFEEQFRKLEEKL
jgi:hypothetical protein